MSVLDEHGLVGAGRRTAPGSRGRDSRIVGRVQPTRSPTVRAELVTAHRLARWVLPLGFAGLGVVAATWMILPRDVGEIAFYVARAVFVVAYLALLVVALSRRRHTAEVHADARGLYEGRTLLVPRDSVDQVLSWTAKGVTTIDVRGRVPILLELRSKADSTALLDVLDPERHTAALSLLATTTPTWIGVLAWMGIPVVLSIPIQALLMARASRDAILAVATACVVVWLFAAWWFIRRRRVTVTPTTIWLPRLFGGEDEIPREELLETKALDVFTLELRFARRRSRRIKVYDPPVLASLVERLR